MSIYLFKNVHVQSRHCLRSNVERQQPDFLILTPASLIPPQLLFTAKVCKIISTVLVEGIFCPFIFTPRYFPASPVQLSTTVGSSITNGGAEAYVELEKALNIVGDYRLSTNVNSMRWAMGTAINPVQPGGAATATSYNELDYCCAITQQYSQTTGPSVTWAVITKTSATAGNSFSGNLGSSCYASSVSLETSNGLEISGLNAEEQSDISFIANWSNTQAAGFVMEVYSYYDAMIVLRENNVVELIQ